MASACIHVNSHFHTYLVVAQGFFAATWTLNSVGLDLAHLLLLAGWVFACGFVRAGGKASGGAIVAQFTPFVMVEIPKEILASAGPPHPPHVCVCVCVRVCVRVCWQTTNACASSCVCGE